MVTKTIFSHKIVVSFLIFHYRINDGVNFRNSAIREENRFDIGIQVTGQNHAVFFLVRTSQLMFFDDAPVVIFARGSANNSILRAAIHGLCINVVFGFFVLNQPVFLLKALEILNRFQVNCFRMNIGSLRAVDFGTGDVKQ